MLSAFFTGFILGFSLILAIGAQNSFVLRQGLIDRHVFAKVLLNKGVISVLSLSGNEQN